METGWKVLTLAVVDDSRTVSKLTQIRPPVAADFKLGSIPRRVPHCRSLAASELVLVRRKVRSDSERDLPLEEPGKIHENELRREKEGD